MTERLTQRQEQCLRLSATMTDKEMARALGISEHTVDKHLRGALRKLGVNSRKAALRRMASDAPYATDAIPESMLPGSVGGVDADRSSIPRQDAAATDDSLYGRYRRLGRWRTPGTAGTRTRAILGWAVLGLIILVFGTGMVGLIFWGTDPFAPTGSNP